MVVIFCGAGIWLILATGSRMYSRNDVPVGSAMAATASSLDQPGSGKTNTTQTIFDNARSSIGILLLQLVVIIIAARIVGLLFKKVGQPPVMGEIIAGIVLGPSLLGWVSPGTMAFLFPASSMDVLKLLSQVGVALFMFIVGVDLDVRHLREKARTAILVSNASIIVPFFLGTALSLLVFRSLAPSSASFAAFALFVGTALSVTAFPVLARILEDRKLIQTELGSIALTCAAVDDVTAWCILAFVIAVAQSGDFQTSLITISLTAAFICAMIFAVKPLLARLFSSRSALISNNRSVLAGTLALVFGCALLTEIIGIHAIFGAFLAGVVMPSTDDLREMFKDKIEPLTTAVLLPLFFAFTGLRMKISVMNDWESWAICAGVIAVAVVGKLGSGMLMARWCGMSWRNSFGLGTLMNTRGLVELIVLNIGYDLGILSERAFAVLVLMALVTTFMTGPMLSLVKIGNGGEASKT